MILAVNDVPTDRLVPYQAAPARIAPDTYVALLVMRQGRFQYFALEPSPP